MFVRLSPQNFDQVVTSKVQCHDVSQRAAEKELNGSSELSGMV